MSRLLGRLATVLVGASFAFPASAADVAKERVTYLRSSYSQAAAQVAQDAAKARLFGAVLAQTFSGFEVHKDGAYWSFSGTLPYVFDPLRHRDSVRAGALWVTVVKPICRSFEERLGAVREIDGVKIQVKTSSGEQHSMPLAGVAPNEVITYLFTPLHLHRYAIGEIGEAELFAHSQVTLNGADLKVDFATDRVQIDSMAREIELFRQRTSR